MQELQAYLNYQTFALLALAGVLLLSLPRRWGPYPLYGGVLVLLGLASSVAHHRIYFVVFCLGLFTAFAEIISRFSDEPTKALNTPQALGYLVLNGLIAVLALYVLRTATANAEWAKASTRLSLAATAGFGSMLIMRSKLFNLKVGGEDVAFGPEQVIRVYFKFMQDAIDRARARSRIEFVRRIMKDVDFDRVHEYSLTMLMASQVMEPERRKHCEETVSDLKAGPLDGRLKSYHLGFLLLNEMGEEFVTQLFRDPPPEWLMRAPIPAAEHGLAAALTFKGILGPSRNAYLAYGTNVYAPQFRERLGWHDMEETVFRETTQPRHCVVPGYRLEFNKPAGEGGGRAGHANLVQDPAAKAEGVVYTLTEEAMKYLDRTENGYVRQTVTALLDGKEVKVETYIAENTCDGLAPEAGYVQQMLLGARAFGFSPEYQEQIEQAAALQPA